MPDVLCLGIIVADMVAKPVISTPPKGGLTLVNSIQLHMGGCAANTASALSKLGFTSSVCGMVGQDSLGEVLINKLQENNVNTEHIRKNTSADTSSSMVLVDNTGERSFIHCTGANGVFSAADVDMGSLNDTKILHIAGTLLMPAFDGEPCAEILRQAKSRGITTTMDTAWDDSGLWMKAVEQSLPYVDVFIPSLSEARMLTKKEDLREMAQVFLDGGVQTVVIKLGTEGCYIKTLDTEYNIKPFHVNAVDATGAGDCFVAGYLAGMLQGLPHNQCGQLANATGAMSVTSVGAANGVKSFADTITFINKHLGQEGHKWQQ
ncbi:MAG: sugar kinase [Firmicutes bacterium]|nr:sugar kinase [Bacillota bacterium]